MAHVLVGQSLVHREVVVTVAGTTVSIDHYLLTVTMRIPPRHTINAYSPWIGFFDRKFVRGEFTFAGAVAGYIVSKFLTPTERFAVWDAVHGIPYSVVQCVLGFNTADDKVEHVTGVYNYVERKLSISKKDGSFEVAVRLPAEVAFPFGVSWAQ